MNKKSLLLAICSVLSLGAGFSQVAVNKDAPFIYDVNNDAEAIVFANQYMPHLLWNSKTDEITSIGGQTGSGVASFSGDGKKVAYTVVSDEINVSTAWKDKSVDESGYTFRFFPTEMYLYALGNGEGKEPVLYYTPKNGSNWQKKNVAVWDLETQQKLPITDTFVGLGYAALNNLYLVGTEGTVLHLKGSLWTLYEPLLEEEEPEGVSYTAINFLPGKNSSTHSEFGVIGLKEKDGTPAVWYTHNSAQTWKKATGVNGVPVCISNQNGIYYMGTQNGRIQVSMDEGLTWQDIWVSESGKPVNCIRFADPDHGMALVADEVYITENSGETWKNVTPEEGFAAQTQWNDLTWADLTATVVGEGGSIATTADLGATWSKVDGPEGVTDDFHGVFSDGKYLSLNGEGAAFYNKNVSGKETGCVAAIYNRENEKVSILPDLGVLYLGASSAWDYSEDGNVVVGMVSTENNYDGLNIQNVQAAVWTNGVLAVLGSKYDHVYRPSRPNKVSYDGSVVVGYQDIMGPWFASVWRKGEDGMYKQNLMFVDPEKTEEDLNLTYLTNSEGKPYIKFDQAICEMMLGECLAVSADGKWIAGEGKPGYYGVADPWIWSEESGLILLDDAGIGGRIADISNDGSMVLGWDTSGDKEAWIWRKGEGKMEINQYVTGKLGYDLGDYSIYSVGNLSPNGRYMACQAWDGKGIYACVLDLFHNAEGIDKVVAQTKASVYPNPVSNELHIDLPFEDVKTSIRLYDTHGVQVRSMSANSTSNTMDVSSLKEGMYILNVAVGTEHKSFKVLVRH